MTSHRQIPPGRHQPKDEPATDRSTARHRADPTAPRPAVARQVTSRHRARNHVLALLTGVVLVSAVSAAAGGAAAVAAYPHAHDVSGHSPTSASAAAQPAARVSGGSIEQVAATVLPSVVELQTPSGGQVQLGSGIILTSDGLILTNNHVVSPAANAPAGANGAQNKVTLADGRTAPFSIVGTDPVDDIAVVRAQGLSGLTPLALGSSSDLKVGQQVVAVGSPLGLSNTVTSGIISALHRPVSPGGDPASAHLDAIQTDAPLNPGNSGGALVNLKGQLIGINTAVAGLASAGGETGSTGLGFAIPVDQGKRVADQLIAAGKSSPAQQNSPVSNSRVAMP